MNTEADSVSADPLRVYSVSEVAELLGLGTASIRRYIQSGALHVTHELAPTNGGDRRFFRISAAEVQRFIDAHAVRPKAQPRATGDPGDGGYAGAMKRVVEREAQRLREAEDQDPDGNVLEQG